MKWKIVQLENVAEVIAGQSPPSEYYNKAGDGIPFFQGKADFGDLFPEVRFWCSKPTKIAKPGDILFSVRAPVGPTNLNKVKACIGRGLSAIRPGEKIDTIFLLHYLRHFEPEIASLGSGSTFKAITQKHLKALQIPLPPLPEQRRLAAILDKAAALRRKDRALLDKYDALVQGVFLERFGDIHSNSKNKQTVRLIEITKKITDGVHHKPEYTTKGIPFISVKDITTGKLSFEGCKYISLEDHKKFSKRCPVEFEDILYTKVGATYGRPAIVDTKREFSLYVSVALIKPDRSKVNPYYLKEALKTESTKRQADKSIKGIGVPDLHLNMIKDFKIILPSLEEQTHFARIVENIEAQKAVVRRQAERSEALFQALLQGAFRGEV